MQVVPLKESDITVQRCNQIKKTAMNANLLHPQYTKGQLWLEAVMNIDHNLSYIIYEKPYFTEQFNAICFNPNKFFESQCIHNDFKIVYGLSR